MLALKVKLSQSKIVKYQIFRKNNEIVVRISALAFKMGKILLYHIILNEQNIPGVS